MVKGAGKYVPVDPFVEQRVQVERDMEKLIKLLKSFELLKHATGRSREVIESQTRIRTEVAALETKLAGLRGLLGSEKKDGQKRELQKEAVRMLEQELENIQDYQRAGYVSSYQRVAFSTVTLDYPPSAGDQRGREKVTPQQHRALEDLHDTDTRIDVELGSLEEGTAALKGLARQQREEVQLQNATLQKLDGSLEGAQEKAETVNSSLSAALRTRKRRHGCDVLATNVLCVGLALALLALLLLLLVQA